MRLHCSTILSFFINFFFSLPGLSPSKSILSPLSLLLCHSLSLSVPLSFWCRRWARLLDSPSFLDLRHRHRHGRIHTTVFAVSAADFGLHAASLRFEDDVDGVCNWKVSLFLANDAVSLGNFHGLLSHARLSAVGSKIFIIGRNAMVRYDTWSGTVVARSAMPFPRK